MFVLPKKLKIINSSDIKKSLGLTLIIAVFVSGFFIFAEPGMTQAANPSTVVVTLSVTAGVSLSVDNSTTAMSTALGVVSNTAVATSTFVVATNDSLGYTLKLNASSTPPAMQSAGSTIPDATTTPTLYSSLIPSGQYAFGFSAYSTSTSDVPAATWETGGHATGCANGANVPSATLKYRGFAGSTQITVASNTSTTTTSGDPIVVCYAVGQNSSYIPSGAYNATITATAITN